MAESFENDEGDIFVRFPGPIILPAGVKWSKPSLIGGALIILSILARYLSDNSIELTLLIFAMAFSGVAFVVMGVIFFLRPGAGLRLNETGFEVVGPLNKKIFRWSEVSDFGVWSRKGHSFVAFKAAKPRLTTSDRINSALTGGKNELLPDTYGMAADDLVQLMTTWRNSATNANQQAGI
jgi:hypothetical protein